ncbi:MAG: hypothetical protein B7X04_03505 [Parcubacteria group bacterium 21-54-25]|nr:MAG: hypothetical protein B7X04_03505 [Parcubacteria group bacterium 21-54-25]HQU08054.1 FAD-dependent oxidoreductase [Candidatus Paceibacterota bacterium]
MNDSTYDLIIIGGGPAGIAGGVYAARKRLSTILLAEEIGGQSAVSEGIENWIGTIKIAGIDFAKALRAHLAAYQQDVVTICEHERVTTLTHTDNVFTATTASGASYRARAVFIAAGAARRKLDVPGAKKFENKGVTYCASCDGPLFSDMDVVVVGGGNAGFETAAQLLAYTKSVTLIHRHKEFKADPVTVEQLLKHPHMHTMVSTEPVEVKGDVFVTGLTVRNKETGETSELPVSGVFVEAGLLPNTDFAKELLALDPTKRIVTNPKNQRTSVEGVWAAGDCTDELYHQNNIAAGDAVKAIEDLYHWLATHKTT